MDYFKRINKYEKVKNELVLKGGDFGDVHIKHAAPGIVRVSLFRSTPWSNTVPPKSYSSILQDEEIPFTLERINSTKLKMQLDEFYLEIDLHPFNVRYFRNDGTPLLKSINGGVYWDGWQIGLRFEQEEDDHYYGLGEADQNAEEIPFDHKGHKHMLWNKHLPAPSRMLFPVILNEKGYGIFIDNQWPSQIDFTDSSEWKYSAQGGYLSYYLIVGADMRDVIDKFTKVVGKPAIPPRYAFGLLQSKYGYKTRGEVERIAATFREKNIPCDAIILDLYWFRAMGDLIFNQKKFPKPKEMIEGLAEKGFKTILIEEPYVVTCSRLYEEGKQLGVFGKKATGETYTFPFWPGESALVDFTNPLAKQWWADKHHELIDMGVAGWWTDLNEPEVHPEDMVHYAGPAAMVHNVFALEMHKALQKAYDQHAPDKRLFILSRSGWPGMQRYGVATWSGDVKTTWEALEKQIVLGLNLGLTGVPYWNTDIGGFIGDEISSELYIRWMQFGAFSPIMRPHGFDADREPWRFGEVAEQMTTSIIKLRYQLIPYIYTLAYEAYSKGLPIMRSLILYYQDDPEVHHIKDQYLFGKHILVAPVVKEGDRTRKLYLPGGRWIDFWSGESYEGKKYITVDAPLEQIPLFVKAGTILPVLSPRDYIDQYEWNELFLHVYPDGKSSFKLYEDDGETTNYQAGEYAITKFTSDLNHHRWAFTISHSGDFNGKVPNREYHVQAKIPFVPREVQVNQKLCAEWEYDETIQKIKIDLPRTNKDLTIVVK